MGYLIGYGILLCICFAVQFWQGLKINFTSIFFILFLIFYGPEFIIYHYNSSGTLNVSETRLAVLMCCFLICFFSANRIIKFYLNSGFEDRFHYRNWISRPINASQPINVVLLYILVITTLTIILVGFFIYGGVNSLREALTMQSLSAEYFNFLRSESGVNGWIAPFYSYTATSIGRFIAFIGLFYGLHYHKTILKYLALLLIVMLLLSQVANLMKSSTVFFLVQCSAAYAVYARKKINGLKILLLLTGMIGLLIGIYLILTNAENSSMALEFIRFRIFDVPNEVLQMYTDTWPDTKPHTWGMNIRLVHMFFGSGTFESSDSYLCGMPGCTFNAIFIGDAWVDFSYYGVIIESLFLGSYLAIIDYWVFRKKTLITMALFPSLLIGIIFSVSVAMLPTMITYGLIAVPVIAFFIKGHAQPRRVVSQIKPATV